MRGYAWNAHLILTIWRLRGRMRTMARRIIHCCLDIEGGIRHAKDLKGCITVDGRTLMTANEVKSFLREQLAMGRQVLPMGDCDNFDYQTGCKGHVVEED
jgi:hypothetical protein